MIPHTYYQVLIREPLTDWYQLVHWGNSLETALHYKFLQQSREGVTVKTHAYVKWRSPNDPFYNYLLN